MSDTDPSNNFCTVQARFTCTDCRGPFIRDFYSLSVDYRTKTGQIEYNGYCYIPETEFPIERELLVFESPDYHSVGMVLHCLRVRIIGKEELEDTSEYWDDPEEGMMCLFPTNRIRLIFELIPMPKPPAPISEFESRPPLLLGVVLEKTIEISSESTEIGDVVEME